MGLKLCFRKKKKKTEKGLQTLALMKEKKSRDFNWGLKCMETLSLCKRYPVRSASYLCITFSCTCGVEEFCYPLSAVTIPESFDLLPEPSLLNFFLVCTFSFLGPCFLQPICFVVFSVLGPVSLNTSPSHLLAFGLVKEGELMHIL